MSDYLGEVTKVDVDFINDDIDVTPDAVSNKANPLKRCCIVWRVMATTEDENPLHNDFSAPIKFFPKIFSCTITLEKYDAGAFSQVATLNDSTYGTAFTLREKDNIQPYGYKVDWSLVLAAFDTGLYRVKFDTGTSAVFSDEYCLEVYSDDSADGTVRFTTTRNSIIGTTNQKTTFDFTGLNWEDQFRLDKAFFGQRTTSIEQESVRRVTGEERTFLKNFRENYRLIVKEMDIFQHRRVLYDIFQNDYMTVSDFNCTNFDRNYNEIAVEVTGGYEPNYALNTPYPSLELDFQDRFNNRRKLYS